MITGFIESQADQIWNVFWSGGISNPLEVIEQITYFPETSDPLSQPCDNFRWSRLERSVTCRSTNGGGTSRGADV